MSGALATGLLDRIPPPAKVAVLRASRIGDFVLATPALRALRAALPGAEISLIALGLARDMAARSPHIDRFIEFPGFPGIAEQLFDARRASRFFRAMQSEEFDVAVQMHGSGVFSNPASLLLGARWTVGAVRAGDPPGRLDAAFPWPEDLHEARRLLALAAFLGAMPRGEAMEFPLFQEDREAAGKVLAGTRPPLIGVHPFAREEGKRWPEASFLAAAREVRRETGGTIVILGERDPGSELVVPGIPVSDPETVDLTGRTLLPVLGAVIERLGMLLTNDSGPAQIAYALGTPSVTVFVDTDPARWGPLGDGPHRAVDLRDGSEGIEEVVGAALSLPVASALPAA
jgi:ADP-heptose:LPS heptosyltransferase